MTFAPENFSLVSRELSGEFHARLSLWTDKVPFSLTARMSITAKLSRENARVKVATLRNEGLSVKQVAARAPGRTGARSSEYAKP
jgi:hypothetical protein